MAVGFKIFVTLGSCPNDFQNNPRGHGFLKNGSQFHDSRGYFWDLIAVIFFLLIYFRGNSFIKLKAILIFLWTFSKFDSF